VDAAVAADAAVATDTLAAPPPGGVQYGADMRLRWISFPGWLLGLLAQENVPVSSHSWSLSLFRRKGDLDMALGFTRQDMTPPDGNWLGKGYKASENTDFVQVRGLTLWGVDASFTWRTDFNDYVGLRYGGGIGIALIRGKVMRISAACREPDPCIDANAGDRRYFYPRIDGCTAKGCSETGLQKSAVPGATGDGGPGDPHRFMQDIPPALPVLSMLLGLSFRTPDAPGLELRVESGFYNAFFLGGGAAYVW
jgi:hypothetical protein